MTPPRSLAIGDMPHYSVNFRTLLTGKLTLLDFPWACELKRKFEVHFDLPRWEMRRLNSKRRKTNECTTFIPLSSKTNKIDNVPWPSLKLKLLLHKFYFPFPSNLRKISKILLRLSCSFNQAQT